MMETMIRHRLTRQGDDSSDQIDYPIDDGSGDSTDGSLDNSDTWEDNGEEVQQIED